MKQSPKLNLTLIIKRVVAITALLALFEVAFIYFYMNGKKSSKASISKAKEIKPAIPAVVKDSLPKENSIIRQEVPQQEVIKFDTINTTPPPVITQPPVAVAKPVPEKIVEKKKVDTIKKKPLQPAPEPVKTIVQRELSHQEMVQLLNDINAKKASLNNQTKCIQIRKTQASNIDNGFEIATFLKQNGFVISGREVVNSNNNGISIDASESCIKITIGTL